LEFIRILGADLIFACGETEKPEVKKSIDEVREWIKNSDKILVSYDWRVVLKESG
jgi:hypothetical protein